MPLKSGSSKQEVAGSVDELKSSYDQLYNSWLGEHYNPQATVQVLTLMKVQDGLLLDVACGLGFLLNMAKTRGASPFGIDISSVALQKAKKIEPNQQLIEGNGENLPWSDNTFDFVTCIGSLEHYIHPEIGVREIARVLKPDGLAAVNLPNSHHIQSIYNVYKSGGILPDLQDYERFATRVEWTALLEDNGLIVQSVHKYNTGFSRIFKQGREPFWYFYNILYRLFGEAWIPLNLSFALTFICSKSPYGFDNNNRP